jgi:uncharacterized protein (DUF305 family)
MRLRVPARTTSNRPSDHRDKLADLKYKKYIEQAGVKDHKAALKLFKDAAEDAKDPELKRFAQKEVDHIQEHLQMAQRIADTKKQRLRASHEEKALPGSGRAFFRAGPRGAPLSAVCYAPFRCSRRHATRRFPDRALR